MLTSIQKELFKKQDKDYQVFSKRLIKTSYPIIGVRAPLLKNYSKQLIADNTPLDKYKDKYHEEIILHGYAISKAKIDINEKIKLIDKYIPILDNWASCDSFIMSLKFIPKNKEIFYKQIKKYLKSNKEFIQRFAMVCLLDYYVQDKEYLDDIFKVLKTEKYNGYYSKMAGAWLLSYCLIFYYEETYEFITTTKLDEFVYKKGIQKTIDSFRVSDARKKKLRTLY